MQLKEVTKKSVDLSNELFELFYQFFGSIHIFDYHLLHRFACLIAVFEHDSDIATKVLRELLSKEGRAQPTKINCVLPRIKLPMPFFGKATVGAHTRTSKFILRRRFDLLPIVTQLLGSGSYLKKFSDIECPPELRSEMENLINRVLGSAYLGELERILGVTKICDKVIKQVNFRTQLIELSSSGKSFMGYDIIVPRPANSFSKSILSIIGDQSRIKMIGHNIAYQPVYKGDEVRNNFPLFVKTDTKYIDDIGALKFKSLSSSLKNKPKILISMFPFGDTGYAEGESNHFYQLSILESLVDIFKNYRKDVIFCLHPGTKNITDIKKRLKVFEVGTGIFDNMLTKAKLVVCTYRGTTCLGTALANNIATVLIKDHDSTNEASFSNLKVCNLGQLSSEIKNYV